jgi:hypothetical protein
MKVLTGFKYFCMLMLAFIMQHNEKQIMPLYKELMDKDTSKTYGNLPFPKSVQERSCLKKCPL